MHIILINYDASLIQGTLRAQEYRIFFILLVTTDAAHHSWLYSVNVKQNANYFIGDEKTNLTNYVDTAMIARWQEKMWS